MSYWQIDNLTQAEILQLLAESLDPKVTGALADDAGGPSRVAPLPVHRAA